MAQNITDVEFVNGLNRFPQLYNCSVKVSASEPQVHIRATTKSHLGTRPDEPRSPDEPMVGIPLSWPDAIRLALEISKMAEAVGVRLPKGVLYRTELQ